MPGAIVIGGGLAGLSAAAALGAVGYEVDLFEARPHTGGRATSYPLNAAESEEIDNCQHVLLGCCVNLLDFYKRLGVEKMIRFDREFSFLEPGGRRSVLKIGPLPAPLHFAGSFPRLKFLGLADKLGIARAMLALKLERGARGDLESITMLDWLREKRQTPRAIERFWRVVLVSAINEELDRMAAAHGFQVFSLGFLSGAEDSRMGTAAVPLGQLYSEDAWKRIPNVRIHLRSTVEQIVIENGEAAGAIVNGGRRKADAYICAVPFERACAVAPELALDVTAFEHSPITGIHLWFDRPVTSLPHATLLDRTIQWAFVKSGGRYVQLVVSASRNLVPLGRNEVIELALNELAEFFPAVREAKLEKAHVVKEVRATFSAVPGLEAKRPPAPTPVRNLFLAGDWTRNGWPATMEGAVRSGYLAAEAVTRAAGLPQRFLIDRR